MSCLQDLGILCPLVERVSFDLLIRLAGTCRSIRAYIVQTGRWKRLLYDWKRPMSLLQQITANMDFRVLSMKPKIRGLFYFCIIRYHEDERDWWCLDEMQYIQKLVCARSRDHPKSPQEIFCPFLKNKGAGAEK